MTAISSCATSTTTARTAASIPGAWAPISRRQARKARRYSIHAPGLPLLILPAYAAFGFRGAQLLIAALAALAGALVFRLVRDVSGEEWTSRASWAAFALLPPMAFYAVSIYPEAVAALATALFLLTSRADPSPRTMLLAATLAAALPWLHPKFLPLGVLGLSLTLVRRGPRLARVAAASLALVGLAGLLVFFHSLYGRASLSAAYGPGFDSDVSLARVPWGLGALLLDRQFGLLALAPLWVLAVPGCVLLFRRAPGDTLRAGLCAAVTLGVGASFSMWWGGTCPPARFVVPALPALAVLLAPALGRWRVLAAGLFGASLGVTLIAAAAPRAIHNRPDGESALLKVLSPAVSLDALWPSFLPEAGPRKSWRSRTPRGDGVDPGLGRATGRRHLGPAAHPGVVAAPRPARRTVGADTGGDTLLAQARAPARRLPAQNRVANPRGWGRGSRRATRRLGRRGPTG